MGKASVAQMRNRMNSGHQRILENLRDRKAAIPHGLPVGEFMGYRRALSTLVRWGAYDGSRITDLGLTLIGAKRCEDCAGQGHVESDMCATCDQAINTTCAACGGRSWIAETSKPTKATPAPVVQPRVVEPPPGYEWEF